LRLRLVMIVLFFYKEVNNTFKELKVKVAAEEVVEVRDESVGQGYGKVDDKDLEIIEKVAMKTGVILDPVYTGKAFCAMINYIRQEPKKWEGKKVVFIHTGGWVGMYAKKEQLKFKYSQVLPLSIDSENTNTKVTNTS